MLSEQNVKYLRVSRSEWTRDCGYSYLETDDRRENCEYVLGNMNFVVCLILSNVESRKYKRKVEVFSLVKVGVIRRKREILG